MDIAPVLSLPVTPDTITFPVTLVARRNDRWRRTGFTEHLPFTYSKAFSVDCNLDSFLEAVFLCMMPLAAA